MSRNAEHALSSDVTSDPRRKESSSPNFLEPVKRHFVPALLLSGSKILVFHSFRCHVMRKELSCKTYDAMYIPLYVYMCTSVSEKLAAFACITESFWIILNKEIAVLSETSVSVYQSEGRNAVEDCNLHHRCVIQISRD